MYDIVSELINAATITTRESLACWAYGMQSILNFSVMVCYIRATRGMDAQPNLL